MKAYLDTRKWRAVVVALLIVAVAAIAVPSVAFGKQTGNCNGLGISGFSPKQGARDKTWVTIFGTHLEGNHYLNVFFKEKGGIQWVHHSDMDLTHLGQGYLIALVPDRAITGPIMIRDGSGCDFAFSKKFVVVDGK